MVQRRIEDPRHDFATEVVRALVEAGHTAYFAGGCVRDELLGRPAKDYDVATDARPEQVRKLFGRKRTLPIGAAFGVIAVIGRKARGEGMVEVATFRTDGDYTDGRHPDAVRYSTPQHDAARRDFTINGMFYDPLAEAVIDYVGGEADLAARCIRAIGDPDQRFAEDHLRLLRAVRFGTALGFEIEAKTWNAIRRNADKIGTVSGERLALELEKIFGVDASARGIALLADCGLLWALFPELLADEEAGGSVFLATVDGLLRSAGACSLAVGLAILLSAKTSGGACEVTLQTLVRRLKLSNATRDGIRFGLRAYRDLLNAHRLPWSRVQPMLVHPQRDVAQALAACWSAQPGRERAGVAFCRERLQWRNEQLDPPPLIDGGVLKSIGLKPGPQFKSLLAQVRAMQLDGDLRTQQEAIDWLQHATR